MTAPSASVKHGSSHIVDAIREVRLLRGRELSVWCGRVGGCTIVAFAPPVVFGLLLWTTQELRSHAAGAVIAAALVAAVFLVARHLGIARVLWTLALQPVVTAWLCLTLAMRVRLELGHWPRPYVDYGSDRPDLHVLVAALSLLFTAPASLVLWLIVVAFALCSGLVRATTALGSMLLLTASSLMLFYVVRLDPFRFFNWLFD
jgi:hypothetical protein